MNNINIMGRLTKDPELNQVGDDGVAVCNFTVAVQRPHVKDKTDFIRCVAWRKTAEFICNYFCKGKMIAINGVLTVRSWKDNDDNPHSITEVLVDNVFFCGDKATDKEKHDEGVEVVEEQFGVQMQEVSEVYNDEDIPF